MGPHATAVQFTPSVARRSEAGVLQTGPEEEVGCPTSQTLSYGQERAKKVIMVELAVQWEEGCEQAHEREMLKYQRLEVKGGKHDCGQWSVHWEYQGEDGKQKDLLVGSATKGRWWAGRPKLMASDLATVKRVNGPNIQWRSATVWQHQLWTKSHSHSTSSDVFNQLIIDVLKPSLKF